MNDLISRQAAIAETARWIGYIDGDMILRIQTGLKKLPSAQPERKTGKWKETDDGWDGTYYVCSECGCPWTLIDGTPFDNGMNYCPNCGAEMMV